MQKLWCFMLPLSTNINMDNSHIFSVRPDRFCPKLQTDKVVWDEVTEFAAKNGCNSILIDLADGVKYKSHPEIACEGAWTPEFLKKELKRLRELGLTPYPKLNFSTSHDAWLGPYQRMISTPTYYKVCKELIDEVCEIFDYPEFFHLGLDEENSINQQKKLFVCVRQHDLIWHDLKFFFNCVRENGSRPWMWYDYYHSHTKEFLENVPTDVLISPWYYRHMYGDVSAPIPTDEKTKMKLGCFKALSEYGYEVLGTASNYFNTFNMRHLLRKSIETTLPEKNKGFMFSSWYPANKKHKYTNLDAIQLAKFAKQEVKEILGE